jgi:hypothetical protein
MQQSGEGHEWGGRHHCSLLLFDPGLQRTVTTHRRARKLRRHIRRSGGEVPVPCITLFMPTGIRGIEAENDTTALAKPALLPICVILSRNSRARHGSSSASRPHSSCSFIHFPQCFQCKSSPFQPFSHVDGYCFAALNFASPVGPDPGESPPGGDNYTSRRGK